MKQLISGRAIYGHQRFVFEILFRLPRGYGGLLEPSS